MPNEKQHRIYPPLLARAREMRHPQTPAESRLWSRLRNAQLGGFKFRRQHPIDRFIADFYCAACRLVIEIDGDSHAAQAEYDVARTAWLNELPRRKRRGITSFLGKRIAASREVSDPIGKNERGYRVIRFANRDVERNLKAVLEAILAECHKAIWEGNSARMSNV
jgi:very-short-patch-repair endonuclease